MKKTFYNESTIDYNDQQIFTANIKNQEGLQDIKQASKYKLINRPQITEAYGQRVQNKISLDAQAQIRAKLRQQMNGLYYDYNINPFLPMIKSEKRQFIRDIKRNGQKVKQIVNFLDPSYRNNHKQAEIDIPTRKFRQMKVDYQLKSQKNINVIKKNYSNGQQNKIRKENQINKFNQKKLSIIQKIENNQCQDIEIQDIAMIKQQNIFMQRGFRPNIFKILRDDSEINGFDYLKKHYFSMNSMVQKNFKFRLGTYRNLSNFARQTITDSYQGTQKMADFIYSDQTVLDINYIGYAEIINIATNRLSTQDFANQGNLKNQKNNEQDSDSSQQHSQTKITYKKKERDHKENYQGDDQQTQQINIFKNKPENEKQWKLAQVYHKNNNFLKKKQEQQIFILSNGVSDVSIVNKLQNEVKQKIGQLIGQNKNNQNKIISKIVQQKKKDSDKSQIIKLKAYKQLLSQKSSFDEMKKKLIRDRQKNRGKFSYKD